MTKRSIPLERINVASPCKADWNKMTGNDQVRFCSECQLNVYNLSNMTRESAENLVQSTEGRLCVKFYKRADGTVISQDCPVGLKAIHQKFARIVTAVASATFTFLAGLGLYNFTRLNIHNEIARLNKTRTASNTPLVSQLFGNTENIPKPTSVPAETPKPICSANKGGAVTEHEEIMGVRLISPEDMSSPSFSPPVVKDDPSSLPPNVVRRSEDVIRKNAINKVTPKYPALAKMAHVEGNVVVEVVIGERGQVDNARVLSGPPLLQQAALSAARKWKFNHTLLNNSPVKVSGVLTFRFSL